MILGIVGLVVSVFVLGALLSRGGKRRARDQYEPQHVCAICRATRFESEMRDDRYLPGDRPMWICRSHELTEAA